MQNFDANEKNYKRIINLKYMPKTLKTLILTFPTMPSSEYMQRINANVLPFLVAGGIATLHSFACLKAATQNPTKNSTKRKFFSPLPPRNFKSQRRRKIETFHVFHHKTVLYMLDVLCAAVVVGCGSTHVLLKRGKKWKFFLSFLSRRSFGFHENQPHDELERGKKLLIGFRLSWL